MSVVNDRADHAAIIHWSGGFYILASGEERWGLKFHQGTLICGNFCQAVNLIVRGLTTCPFRSQMKPEPVP